MEDRFHIVVLDTFPALPGAGDAGAGAGMSARYVSFTSPGTEAHSSLPSTYMEGSSHVVVLDAFPPLPGVSDAGAGAGMSALYVAFALDGWAADCRTKPMTIETMTRMADMAKLMHYTPC